MRAVMTRLMICVPAKVNLHLQVVGKRTDGFHELRTLFQSVDLYDHLEASQAPDGFLELEVEPAGLDLGGNDNLILLAARALWRTTGQSPGAFIGLRKTIPVGGGLGGGSADCAAALVLLDRLWGLNLGWSRLYDLAASLGSDVPFFLHGGFALGVGRGDEVLPLADLDPLGVLILTPPVSVPTAQVFGRVQSSGRWGRMSAPVYASLVEANAGIEWPLLVNDLESTVCDGWPPVAEALRTLRRLSPVYAAVTGSGASVFAVFESVDEAAKAAGMIDTRCRVEACRTLNREEARLVVRGAETRGDSVPTAT